MLCDARSRCLLALESLASSARLPAPEGELAITRRGLEGISAPALPAHGIACDEERGSRWTTSTHGRIYGDNRVVTPGGGCKVHNRDLLPRRRGSNHVMGTCPSHDASVVPGPAPAAPNPHSRNAGVPTARSMPTRWFGQSPLVLENEFSLTDIQSVWKHMAALLRDTSWQGAEQEEPIPSLTVASSRRAGGLSHGLSRAGSPGAPNKWYLIHHADMHIIRSYTQSWLFSTPDVI